MPPGRSVNGTRSSSVLPRRRVIRTRPPNIAHQNIVACTRTAVSGADGCNTHSAHEHNGRVVCWRTTKSRELERAEPYSRSGSLSWWQSRIAKSQWCCGLEEVKTSASTPQALGQVAPPECVGRAVDGFASPSVGSRSRGGGHLKMAVDVESSRASMPGAAMATGGCAGQVGEGLHDLLRAGCDGRYCRLAGRLNDRHLVALTAFVVGGHRHLDGRAVGWCDRRRYARVDLRVRLSH